MGRAQTALRAVELCLLLAAAAFALWFQLSLPGRLPAEADHAKVGAHLQAHALPGDVLVLVPWWTERARLHAPEGLPVVGYQGAYDDALTAHPRIWVLAQPKLPRDDLDAFEAAFLPGRTAVGPPVQAGHLVLTLYENGRHRPLRFSAAERVADLRVSLLSPEGERIPCRFDGRAHHCPGGPRVAAEWHESLFEPRRCLWAPPPGEGRRLEIALPPLPETALWSLEAGYVWDRGWFDLPRLSSTQVALETDAGRVLDLPLPRGTEGVQHARAHRVPGAGARLVVSAANPELRDVCLDLLGYGDPR